jgi:membrane protein DedA with SNARE-associated domain
MRWQRVLPANAAGGLVWAAAYTIATYLAGQALRQLSGTITLGLAAAAVAATAGLILLIRRQTSRLALRAEAAYPGPFS